MKSLNFILFVLEELDHLFLGWLRFRPEDCKKLPCVPPELIQRTSAPLSSECFIKVDERNGSVLREDALCSEWDLSQRSRADASCVCPTGLLCCACWSFFLLSSEQLSNC